MPASPAAVVPSLKDSFDPAWSVAVFARDECRRIEGALSSIMASLAGHPADVVVLANGCRDRTAEVVRRVAQRWPTIRLVEIPLADKANAWNVYLHEVLQSRQVQPGSTHFFVDGDVVVDRRACGALDVTLKQLSTVNAVGGMPVNGRDRDRWRARMLASGTLSGGLYALRGEFVERLRSDKIRLPTGFIGEDWLVSLLARDLPGTREGSSAAPTVAFSPEAGFSICSLNPVSLHDARIYFRRLWRQALRGVQFEMLASLLSRESIRTMPDDVQALYLRGTPPSRLRWIGWTSFLRTIVVQRIRLIRNRVRRQAEISGDRSFRHHTESRGRGCDSVASGGDNP